MFKIAVYITYINIFVTKQMGVILQLFMINNVKNSKSFN